MASREEIWSHPLLLTDTPTGPFALPKLFKDSIASVPLEWQIGYEDQELQTYHGAVGGVIQPKKRAVELNKSGLDFIQQAWINATSRYREKFREGYRPMGDTTAMVKSPMLAQKYSQTAVQFFPIATQIKLDGIRLLVRLNDRSLVCRSRRNKVYTHLAKHFAELVNLFSYLPAGAELDGELCMEGVTFNKLSGIIRADVNVKKDQLALLTYHLFDIIVYDTPWTKRFEILSKAVEAYAANNQDSIINQLNLVPYFIANNEEEIQEYHQIFIEAKYEGSILRHMDFDGMSKKQRELTLYKSGRAKNILKLKDFDDEEGTIIDVVAAKGTEEDAAIFVVKNDEGVSLKVRMSGSIERRREWFKDPPIGKRLTYIYQGKSEYGVPRFPRGKEIRDYE